MLILMWACSFDQGELIHIPVEIRKPILSHVITADATLK